jgi:hypothetical protein
LIERDFTNDESNLYEIREKTLSAINSDTLLFKTYKNTNLNIIPLISGGQKKVYILTGPAQTGVVIFGNDYLLTFDGDNKVISKKQLHQNIIPVNYVNTDEDGKEIEGTIHSHLPETGDFITATDICTLMLYEKFTKWKHHDVVSENYLNIWDCLTDHLIVVPMRIDDKKNNSKEKRTKKNKNN